jgi:hypothetical protein
MRGRKSLHLKEEIVANNPYGNDEVGKREQLSTADLAEAGRQEPRNLRPSSATPVEVVRLTREEEQRSTESAAAASGQALTAMQHGTAGTAAATAKEPEAGPLFSREEADKLRAQWDSIQVRFVDDPRKAVEEAHGLVAAAMKRLAEQFAAERSKLEGQWDRGGDVSTEELRLSLRRYRSFFARQLSV